MPQLTNNIWMGCFFFSVGITAPILAQNVVRELAFEAEPSMTSPGPQSIVSPVNADSTLAASLATSPVAPNAFGDAPLGETPLDLSSSPPAARSPRGGSQ